MHLLHLLHNGGAAARKGVPRVLKAAQFRHADHQLQTTLFEVGQSEGVITIVLKIPDQGVRTTAAYCRAQGFPSESGIKKFQLVFRDHKNWPQNGSLSAR